MSLPSTFGTKLSNSTVTEPPNPREKKPVEPLTTQSSTPSTFSSSVRFGSVIAAPFFFSEYATLICIKNFYEVSDRKLYFTIKEYTVLCYFIFCINKTVLNRNINLFPIFLHLFTCCPWTNIWINHL